MPTPRPFTVDQSARLVPRLDRLTSLARHLTGAAIAGLSLEGADPPMAETACCAAVRAEGEPIVASDLRRDRRFMGERPAQAPDGRGALASYAGVPVPGHPDAVFYVGDLRVRRYGPQVLAAIADLAALTGDALDAAEAEAAEELARCVPAARPMAPTASGAAGRAAPEPDTFAELGRQQAIGRLFANTIAREESHRQRLELERLKGDFVNAVSHELRTPLCSIMGFAEFLNERVGGALSPEQESYVHEILAGATRLQGILDDMLDLGRLEARSFKLVLARGDLVRLIREALDSLAPQAREAGVEVELQLPEAPVWTRMDPRRVGQVMLNLAGNALKFTPRGGRVRIACRRAGDRVVVEVADTGIGIPTEAIPRLFDKFYQVDSALTRARNGAGLGLAIAKALVEAHGGVIEVESAPGAGAAFRFSLPACD